MKKFNLYWRYPEKVNHRLSNIFDQEVEGTVEPFKNSFIITLKDERIFLIPCDMIAAIVFEKPFTNTVK